MCRIQNSPAGSTAITTPPVFSPQAVATCPSFPTILPSSALYTRSRRPKHLAHSLQTAIVHPDETLSDVARLLPVLHNSPQYLAAQSQASARSGGRSLGPRSPLFQRNRTPPSADEPTFVHHAAPIQSPSGFPRPLPRFHLFPEVVRCRLRHHAPLQPASFHRVKLPHVLAPSPTTIASTCSSTSGCHPPHRWQMPPPYRTASLHTHQPRSPHTENVR